MAQLSADAETVRRNLATTQRRIDEACARVERAPGEVRVCVATKYVDAAGMAALREAGVRIAAENRLQDMTAKQEQFGGDFEWHFIGSIQSRKIREIAERVTTIHSLASESARDKLAGMERPPTLLVQVNVGEEESKSGIEPAALGEFLAGCPIAVSGLMTMPPLAATPEDARPYFRALAALAAEHGLSELSMGTTQDFEVAVEEGATLVRVGSAIFAA
ncbi:MAG: YggS family pyridoxal phosphate-dependent enzyme [Solirubrobacterales bacterium]